MTIAGVAVIGASFFSTHYASPNDALAARPRAATEPSFSLLRGRARRFTSLAIQMHCEVCGTLARQDSDRMPSVFATCHGEIQTAETLIADLFASRVVSSARFALSVHNAPAGLYAVATGTTAPSTTVTGANAVAAGWLEAALTALDSNRPVLLSIADEPVPAVFRGPVAVAGVAAAFVVAPLTGGDQRAELVFAPQTQRTTAPDILHTLARATDAVVRGRADTIPLGPIREGVGLELRMEARP